MACFDGLKNWERDLEAIEKKYCQRETSDPSLLVEMTMDEMCEFFEKKEQNGLGLHHSDNSDTEEEEEEEDVAEEKSFNDGIFLEKLKDFRKDYEKRAEEENKKIPIDFLCLETGKIDRKNESRISHDQSMESETDPDDSQCYPSDIYHATSSTGKMIGTGKRNRKNELTLNLDPSIESETDPDGLGLHHSDNSDTEEEEEEEEEEEDVAEEKSFNDGIFLEKLKVFRKDYEKRAEEENKKIPIDFLCLETGKIDRKNESRISHDQSMESETDPDDSQCYPSDIYHVTSSMGNKKRTGKITLSKERKKKRERLTYKSYYRPSVKWENIERI